MDFQVYLKYLKFKILNVDFGYWSLDFENLKFVILSILNSTRRRIKFGLSPLGTLGERNLGLEN
jgi:hypothetical protein